MRQALFIIPRAGQTAFVAAALLAALATSSRAQALSDTLQLGQRLYMTSCGLCHSNPDLVNKAPAPALSKATLNGNADDIAMFIKTGTATMPSFEFMFSDAELAAIAQFIKTLPEAEAAK